jgi:hypothetical protein
MNKFHQLIPKKLWFLLFNLGATTYMILGGHLHWNFISIFSFLTASAIMNGIALVSSRNFPDRK